MQSRAYTILEILTVMAIIAVLAALLMPVLSAVRGNAKKTECLSNERQLGGAIQMYVADYDEKFPSTTETSNWALAIFPLVKSSSVYECPDDTLDDVHAPNRSSYGLNENVDGAVLTSFSATSKTVMLYEVSGCGADFHKGRHPGTEGNGWQVDGEGILDACDIGDHPVFTTGNMGGHILNNGFGSIPRHRGGADYLACDGHVRWLQPADVSCGDSAVSPLDNQGGGPKKSRAAGTGNDNYILTFSNR